MRIKVRYIMGDSSVPITFKIQINNAFFKLYIFFTLTNCVLIFPDYWRFFIESI